MSAAITAIKDFQYTARAFYGDAETLEGAFMDAVIQMAVYSIQKIQAESV